jgi:hypothetical protein
MKSNHMPQKQNWWKSSLLKRACQSRTDKARYEATKEAIVQKKPHIEVEKDWAKKDLEAKKIINRITKLS